MKNFYYFIEKKLSIKYIINFYKIFSNGSLKWYFRIIEVNEYNKNFKNQK